jgi:hypothetical protein
MKGIQVRIFFDAQSVAYREPVVDGTVQEIEVAAH